MRSYNPRRNTEETINRITGADTGSPRTADKGARCEDKNPEELEDNLNFRVKKKEESRKLWKRIEFVLTIMA